MTRPVGFTAPDRPSEDGGAFTRNDDPTRVLPDDNTRGFMVHDASPVVAFAMDAGLWRVDGDPGDDSEYARMTARQLTVLAALADRVARNARATLNGR